MQAVLMNLGDNVRVVNNSKNIPMAIGIGEVRECDLHDVHFNMIRHAVKRETLFAVPKDTQISPTLAEIMEVVKVIRDEPYDDLLRSFNKVIPHDPDAPVLRPSRDQMRHMLRLAATHELRSIAYQSTKVNIREEGDEVTRQPVPDNIKHEIPGLVQEPEQPEQPAPKVAAPRKPRRSAAKKKGKDAPRARFIA